MTRQYAPKTFLRHVPAPLLKRFFESEGLPIALDWAAGGDDVDALYDAWLDLAPAHREHAEAMFRRVHELADPQAARMLAEEATFQGRDLSGLDPEYGYHAAALWMLLTYPTVVHQVALIRHADQLPGRYWHKVTGLPVGRKPDTSPAARQRLKGVIADYFRAEQGRGHRVTVEYYQRAGAEHYFFCYPDDYTHTLVGHDERGTLRRLPRRPAFEVVFAHAPADGALELYAPGPKLVRQTLQDLFCQAVLDTVPPPEEPHRPAYELDRLLDRSLPLATDPEDAVREVRVRRLRVAVPNAGRRVVLEGNPDGPRDDVFDFLDELLPADRYPRDRLHVTQATFTLTYRPAGADRDRSLTFDVSYPDSCSLKSRPEDQRLLGEKYLRRWGIARA